jgi:hypothetical protein
VNISFEETYHVILNFLHANPYIAIALALVLLYLLFRKPKVFLVLLLILTVLTTVFYVISQISEESVITKEEMIKERELPR